MSRKKIKAKYSREYILLRRLISFNQKKVTTEQVRKLLFDTSSELQRNPQKQVLRLVNERLERLIMSLDLHQITIIKKFELSNEILEKATKIVTKPKIKNVTLGDIKPNIQNVENKIVRINSKYKNNENKATDKLKSKQLNIDTTSLYGIEIYNQQQAEKLGILENGLCGVDKPRNPYDVVNRIIIRKLQTGTVPWETPWVYDINGFTVVPRNFGSNRNYEGINFWATLWEMDVRNHTQPFFLTKKQIAEFGGKLNKGAKPYYITYYGKFTAVEENTNKNGKIELDEKIIRFLKLYSVYCIEDTTGIDYEPVQKITPKKAIRIESAEQIIKNMPKRPKIIFGGNKASYSPSTDIVRMPKPENFKQIDRYYSTLFHELIHSTQNDKRCGTDHFRKNSKRFADKQYSWEELVAELGACYLCSQAGILHKTVSYSASYIDGWAKALQTFIKNDKTYFFKAANYAQKAADFILRKDGLNGLLPEDNAINGDEIVKTIKEVFPSATVIEIPEKKNPNKKHPFTNVNELQSGGTYQLNGELGKFLGNLGEVDCSVTIRGDQGAGKSQLMWQMVDAFADINKRVAIISPEMSGKSPTIQKYRDQFIKPSNQSKILFTDKKLSVEEIAKLAHNFDVVFVDSFNQLENYQQKQFEWLSKQLPTKCIIGLFQSTTGGEMRGGNSPEFDAYINVEVNKVDDSFKNNYAVCTKNRFGSTGVKYNISKQKIVK